MKLLFGLFAFLALLASAGSAGADGNPFNPTSTYMDIFAAPAAGSTILDVDFVWVVAPVGAAFKIGDTIHQITSVCVYKAYYDPLDGTPRYSAVIEINPAYQGKEAAQYLGILVRWEMGLADPKKWP